MTNSTSKTHSKQISPSSKWCGTYNNYDSSIVPQFLDILRKKNLLYMIGKEVGKSGTPHLQIFIYNPNGKKFRPIPSCNPTGVKIHWERCKGSVQQNIDYCKKDGDYMTNIIEYMPCVCREPPRLPIMNDAWLKWFHTGKCEVCQLKDKKEAECAKTEQQEHDMAKWEEKLIRANMKNGFKIAHCGQECK